MIKIISLFIFIAACILPSYGSDKELLRNSGFYEAGINSRKIPRWWDVKSGNSTAVDVKVYLKKSKHIIDLTIPGKSAVIETHFYRIACSSLAANESYQLSVYGAGKASMQFTLHTYDANGRFLKSLQLGSFPFDNGGAITVDDLAGKLQGAARFAPAIFITSDKCVLSRISLKQVKKKATAPDRK